MFYYFKALESYVNISFIARIFASEEIDAGQMGLDDPKGNGKFRAVALMLSAKTDIPSSPIQISGTIHDTMDGAREECESIVKELGICSTEQSTLLN